MCILWVQSSVYWVVCFIDSVFVFLATSISVEAEPQLLQPDPVPAGRHRDGTGRPGGFHP